MVRIVRLLTVALFTLALTVAQSFGQGVTTASFFGQVTDTEAQPLAGATVVAVHVPSGTRYGTITREDGRFNLPSVRIGGPYTVSVTYIGYNKQEESNIQLTLGQNFRVNVQLREESVTTEEVTITASRSEVKNGASTNISNQVINSMPTLSRRLSDFTRLTPQANGTSFGGQDNRFNNITVDGSSFNSSFGLGGQPGDRTGVSPISLDAIEEVQVSLAPYDVRQAGFVGAGINAVTRSGSNDVSASAYFLTRSLGSKDLLGDSARGVYVPRGNFNYYQTGLRVGGPIIKDKLFFFVSAEVERNALPNTTFRPNEGTEPVTGSVSRVLKSELEGLSSFLSNSFNYETGPYNNYNLNTTADKLLARVDYNLNDNNKVSLRYTYLNSGQDVPISNSNSLGFGSRQPSANAFSYQNSNYTINEDIQSVIGEWNANFGNRASNNFIIGYTYQDEDRGDFGDDDAKNTAPTFPLVEIQENGSNYISFGNEPFTPYNQLSYSTFQIADNFTYFANSHKITAGFNVERLQFRNVFFPGSQSVYVYNSIEDFYADANATLAGTRDTSTTTLRRFQLRYSALPNGAEPVQPTKVTYAGVYLQDEWQINNSFNVTAGVRLDVPIFGQTGFRNEAVESLNFVNDAGEATKFATDKLPNANLLISPRIGFNWNATDDGSTRVRGGTGIFTGRPAFVWISNQIGNNGVLTGFIQSDNTRKYPFSADPTKYIPENPTLPSSYELALTDPNFRFPQVWRSNLAIEQKLPLGLIGTVEVLFNRDVNAVKYYNANLPLTDTAFAGPDNRPRYLDGTINNNISTAVVLTNTKEGYAYSVTLQLERPFKNGLYVKAAYNFGQAKNITNAGSIAVGSWTGNPIGTNPNNPALAFADGDQRHRVIGALSYRKELFNALALQVGIFYEGRNQNRFSYTYSGDMNGDGAFNNELIYVPTSASELNFQQYTSGSATFTVEQQEAAFEAYISQDEYLNSIRGGYAERNGFTLPWLNRMDLNFVVEPFFNVGGKRNSIQLRADVLNFGNLLNSKWGVGQQVINNRPLVARGVNAAGEPLYRFANLGTNLLSSSYRYTNSLSDVWQMQIGIRYTFN